MRRLATAHFSFFLLLLFSASAPAQVSPIGGVDAAIIEGVLLIKLDEPTTAAVEAGTDVRGVVVEKTSDGVPRTGVAALDSLSREYAVAHIERVFRPAGRHETRHRAFGLHRWYRIVFDDASPAQTVAGVRDAVAAYAARPGVEIAEPLYDVALAGGDPGVTPVRVDQSARVQTTGSAGGGNTNDPLFSDQWHYHNTGQTDGTPDADIDLPEAFDLETGSPNVIVSIHDLGIDVDHEDLAANMWINDGEIPGNEIDDDNNGYVDDVHGYNFFSDQGTITAGGHGTHVAGTVAAVNDNGTGVAGVAGGDGSAGSGIRLMSMQIAAPNGQFGTIGAMAESYTYAADMGAVISQNSWGFTQPGAVNQAILDAIDYYIANAGSGGAPVNGGVVVFAAGNSNADGQWYPGYYAPTIAVAATGHSDVKADYSNFGEWIDVSAPGGTGPGGSTPDEDDVLSTLPNNGYGYAYGTSMAAPHVSGLLGLMASRTPGITNENVRTLLEMTTDDISTQNPDHDGLLGTGRINAYEALAQGELDETPPDAVTDLAVVAEGSSIEITWTAPADDAGDPTSGPVDTYRIRYSTEGPIADSLGFENATPVVNPPVPVEPGTQQSIVIEGLDFETPYWFALRAIDDFSNASPISNSPNATTAPAPVLAFSPDSLEVIQPINDEQDLTLSLSNTAPPESRLHFTFPAFAAMELLEATPAHLHNDVSRPAGEVGRPVTLGAGGPDEHGYLWIDSNEPGGPIFDWFDITGVGTEVALTDDRGGQESAWVELPFSFPFYGEEQDSIRIHNNGHLHFGEERDNVFFIVNDPIPDDGLPNGLIAPFWENLDPDVGEGTVHHYYDEPGEQFVIQFTDMRRKFGGEDDTYTFQAMLGEDGTILFQYLDMESTGSLDNSTVGIENYDGTVGLQVAYNTDYLEDSLAVAISDIPEFIANVSPSSGTINGGSSQDVMVTMTSENTDVGTYERDLRVLTNAPGSPLTEIPTRAIITGGPAQVTVTPTSLDYGQVYDGYEAVQTVTLKNVGASDLHIFGFSSDNPIFVPDFDETIVVPFSDSVMVDVAFQPGIGVETGTLTIQSSAENAPTITIPLEGEGLPTPALTYMPDSLGATVAPNSEETLALTLSNDGAPNSALAFTFPAFAATALLAGTPEGLHNDVSRPTGDAGHPVTLGAGGPDDYGYTWIDSNESGGPAFNWIDITEIGTELELTDGGGRTPSMQVDLPFPFPFYGEEQTRIRIDHNGVLLFESEDSIPLPTYGTNLPIPHELEPSAFIAPFWDELDPEEGDGRIHYYADLAHNRFIVQYTDIWTGGFSPDGPYTFQVILTEFGRVYFQYLDIENDNPDSYTIGIENYDGSVGLQVAFNTTYAQDSLAIAIANLPEFITEVVPVSDTLVAGQSLSVDVTVSAADVPPGDYEHHLALATNDPEVAFVDIPAGMSVDGGVPDIAVDSLHLDFGEVLVGSTGARSFTITNEGSLLEVTGITSDNAAFEPDSEGGFDLAYSGSRVITVTFSPTEPATASGTLTISSNDPDEPTVTVTLEGDGVPAPAIAVAPDSVMQEVPRGTSTTVEDLLMITNEGDGELQFTASYLADIDPSSGITRADVAATAPGTRSSASGGASLTNTAGDSDAKTRESLPSLDTMEAVYQLDDGTSESALGLGAPAYDFMWLNAFDVIGSYTTVTAISTAWNCWNCSGPPIPEGTTAYALVYDDPNDDGDPNDAVLLTETEIMVQDPETDLFTTAAIEPTTVEGVFFIAVLLPNTTTNPAPLDVHEPFQEASWAVGSDPNSFNKENLSDNPLRPPLYLGDTQFAGNWLLRAEATSDLVAVSPTQGTVTPGESLTLDVTLDATNLTTGAYTGDILVTNNDPVMPQVEVPATVEVMPSSGPILAVDPDSLDFGDVIVGMESTRSITVRNDGDAPLEVTDISSDTPTFTSTFDGPFTVPGGDSIAVDVTFAPESAGEVTGVLAIESNAPDTVTVALEGVGALSPAIAVSPDSLSQDVQIGSSRVVSEAITISNEGEGELAFTAAFVQDAEVSGLFIPEQVAAKWPGGETTPESVDGWKGTTGVAAAKRTMAGGVDSTDSVYQLDDGTSEASLGLNGSGDVLWLNAFEVADGFNTITAVSTTWGCVECPGQPPADHPATVFVYEDPNNDGNPSDAVLLTTADIEVEDPGTDLFTTASIEATPVEGVFFIAVLYRNQASGVTPLPLDLNSGYQGASWVVGHSTPGELDEENLSNNSNPPLQTHNIPGFGGNVLLRADASSNIVAVVPAEGVVSPGDSLTLDAHFDATTLEVGSYTGDIVISSNDSANPEVAVATRMEVTTAPFPFDLSPEAISVEINLAEGDSTTTAPFTIANPTDEEQFFLNEMHGASGNAPPQDVEIIAYASRRGSGGMDFVSFDLSDPETLTSIGPSPLVFGADFVMGDDETLYVITGPPDHAFLVVDVTTGETAQIASIPPPSGEGIWAGLVGDPTDGRLYLASHSHLYEVDPETGDVDLKGPFGAGVNIVAIAVDGDGEMYGHNTGTYPESSRLVSIDKEMGEATDIGPTGFATTFVQGMDYDLVSGELYMAACINRPEGGCLADLRTVDMETGATTVIATWDSEDAFDGLAFSSTPFLFIETPLLSGTLASGGEVTIDAQLDASSLLVGTYEASLVVISDEPGRPEDVIPVTLEVIDQPIADEASPEEIVEGLGLPRPNPARATATFTVAVKESQDVTVEVFDVTGRRVQMLYEGALAGGMSETLTLNASVLPAGVYVIRAIGEDFAKTRSVTVVR